MEIDNPTTYITWDNYPYNVPNSLRSFQLLQDFTDVCMISQSKSVYVHKLLLAASSPVLYKILKESTSELCTLIFADTDPDIIEHFSYFLYDGATNIPNHKLLEFHQLTKSLQITGIGGHIYDGSNSEQDLNTWSHGLEFNSRTKTLAIKSNREDFTHNGIVHISNKDYKDADVFTSQHLNHPGLSYLGSFHPTSKYINENSTEIAEFSSYETELQVKQEMGDASQIKENGTSQIEDTKTCPLCNKEFASCTNVKRHMRSVHGPDAPPFKLCPIKSCKVKVKDEAAVISHLIRYHKNTDSVANEITEKMKIPKNSNEEDCHICFLCNRKYSSDHNLYRHMKTVHTRKNGNGDNGDDKENIESNLNTASNDSSKSFTDNTHITASKEPFSSLSTFNTSSWSCPVCSTKLSSPGNLSRHMRNVHKQVSVGLRNANIKNSIPPERKKIPAASPLKPGTKLHECWICHRILCSTASLMRHMKNVHKSPQEGSDDSLDIAIACPVSKCSSKFKKEKYKRVHLRIFHPELEKLYQ